MADFIVVLLLLVVMFPIIASVAESFKSIKLPKGNHSSFSSQSQGDHEPPHHGPAATLPSARLTALNVNESFLAGVRSRSCYAALRTTHGVITTLGIVSVAVLWGMMMYAAMGSIDRIYTSVVCALIAAALFIEYGFFRMIVDAFDLLIDTSRRKAEGNA